MDSLSNIETQLNEAKVKRKTLIVEAFAGRTQKYISDKTGIDEIKLSRWVNNTGSLTDDEVSTLEKFLGVEFK